MRKHKYLLALLAVVMTGITNHGMAEPAAQTSAELSDMWPNESREEAAREIMQKLGIVVFASIECLKPLERKETQDEYLKNTWIKPNNRYHSVLDPYIDRMNKQAVQDFGLKVGDIKTQLFKGSAANAAQSEFDSYFTNKDKKEGCTNLLKDIEAGKFDIKNSTKFKEIEELTNFMENNP